MATNFHNFAFCLILYYFQTIEQLFWRVYMLGLHANTYNQKNTFFYVFQILNSVLMNSFYAWQKKCQVF